MVPVFFIALGVIVRFSVITLYVMVPVIFGHTQCYGCLWSHSVLWLSLVTLSVIVPVFFGHTHIMVPVIFGHT